MEGTSNLAAELDGIFQRQETIERKCTVRRQCQGQSWMDRAPSTDTGEGEGASRWSMHQAMASKVQGPPKGTKLSLLHVPQIEEVGGSSSATSLAPPSSHQSPHLAAFSAEGSPWQWGTLSGNGGQGMTEHKSSSPVCVSTLLNWGS